jgi:outer membrane protein assembly factor BamD (BamD/ComL family)
LIVIKKSRSGWQILLFSMLLPMLSFAQPGASVNLEKPKKYENRVLASEKPTDKPLNPVKKAGQNLNTRYNFYFNSEKKINDIIFNARSSFKDNFATLIPFYNYDLDGTASQGNDLDSVLMKCNDAILLHDLRNDWVDDLYLMMGKAYFYKKNFDSAAITFQYVNYAFQPRKKDEIGNIKYIGSNSNETGNVYTISTREKKNIVNNTLGHTPARNESLLWLTRTFIEKGNYGEAGSMVETLLRDANFPKRLEPELKEIQAYLHYTQGAYDSAAHFLKQALDNADDIQEKARWEYLLAQLSEINKDPAAADEWYDKVITHTTDPIMEAYARISRIRLISGDDEDKRIQSNIEELMKMVKKYKYEDYKHIIYYAAAQMEISRDQYDPAMNYLKLAGLNSANDPGFRNKAYLELSDLAFDQRKYKVAAMGYDSIDINDPAILEPDRIQDRKILLAEIIRNYETIRVEDSLLRIASMPEQERTAYVKSLVKKLRKEKGLKDEAANQASFMGGTSSVIDPTKQDQPADLFADNSGKGDWYFYNNSVKSRGSRDFKSAWGNRPNVDNWRRASAVSQQALALQPPARTEIVPVNTAVTPNSKTTPSDLTSEALSANIPLTPDMVQASNDSIALALHQLGKIYREKTGDCPSLITNNEELLNRFPQSVYAEEALFGLYYCHQKNGNAERAAFYKDYMTKNYSQSKFLRMINDPRKADAENKALATAATKKYEGIYNSFIEGDFNRALAEKKKADSSYGENFWTPQLLYIESIYYIKQREDSTAITTLNKLIALYPESPMSVKAGNMISVLKRRSDIENYLTNLNIERARADSFTVALDTEKAQAKKAASVTVGVDKIVSKKPELVAPEIPKNKETVSKTPVKAGEVTSATTQPLTAKVDSSNFKIPVLEKKADGYNFVPTDQYLVVLLLDKVDVVYINEARNALNRYNREKFTQKALELTATTTFDETRKIIPIATFKGVVEAHDYMTRASSSAASEIFPWMPKEKYSFFVITAGNLELLKTKKDLKQYLDLLQQNIPLK